MFTSVITEYRPHFAPAYVANGLVGLRIGGNPFVGGTALLNGFVGKHELEQVEGYAPAPYPSAATCSLKTCGFPSARTWCVSGSSSTIFPAEN